MCELFKTENSETGYHCTNNKYYHHRCKVLLDEIEKNPKRVQEVLNKQWEVLMHILEIYEILLELDKLGMYAGVETEELILCAVEDGYFD